MNKPKNWSEKTIELLHREIELMRLQLTDKEDKGLLRFYNPSLTKKDVLINIHDLCVRTINGRIPITE